MAGGKNDKALRGRHLEALVCNRSDLVLGTGRSTSHYLWQRAQLLNNLMSKVDWGNVRCRRSRSKIDGQWVLGVHPQVKFSSVFFKVNVLRVREQPSPLRRHGSLHAVAERLVRFAQRRS